MMGNEIVLKKNYFCRASDIRRFLAIPFSFLRAKKAFGITQFFLALTHSPGIDLSF